MNVRLESIKNKKEIIMKKVSLNKRLTLNKRTIVHLDNRTLNNINGGYNPFSLPTCEIDCPLTMTDLERTKKRDTDICTNACE